MSLLKNLFGKKEEPIKSHTDFWNWFAKNENVFHNVVKQQGDIHKDFFDKLLPRLNELKDGYLFLTGMCDDNTAELIITVDGAIKNIVFAEELIHAAPEIPGWKFTALKPAINLESFNIEMAGFKFGNDNLHFYSNDHPDQPDLIDITVIHDDFNESNRPTITNGIYIFLDNYLGELNFATIIDNLSVEGKNRAQKELIPIKKLKHFLDWRQKEFTEKYDGIRHSLENDQHSVLEAEMKNGNVLVAVINTDLLNWDSKASHPWILTVEIKFNGEDNRGMPDAATLELLEEIENKIESELRDVNGYLYVGRQTVDSVREIYFACKDFRKPSKVMHAIQCIYSSKTKIDYHIFQDKYWQSFKRFTTN